MIRPQLSKVANGTKLTSDLVNSIINRTEYAADLLRQYKLTAGTDMYVEPHYDGTRVSYLQPVAGGATRVQPISNVYYIKDNEGTDANPFTIADVLRIFGDPNKIINLEPQKRYKVVGSEYLYFYGNCFVANNSVIGAFFGMVAYNTDIDGGGRIIASDLCNGTGPDQNNPRNAMPPFWITTSYVNRASPEGRAEVPGGYIKSTYITY
jgi:hypothetical protein